MDSKEELTEMAALQERMRRLEAEHAEFETLVARAIRALCRTDQVILDGLRSVVHKITGKSARELDDYTTPDQFN